MIRRSSLPLVAALILFAAACVPACADAPNVSAAKYEVTADILPDGSLDVIERIALTVGATPITTFERSVPGRRTDGLTDVVAFIDGRVAPPLTNGAGVRIRQRAGTGGFDARWEFEPAANRSLTFELRYRALHVLSRDEAGLRLRWTTLPTEHRYPIDAARVTLRAPQTTLAVSVAAEGGDLQPSTSWQDGLVVTRSGIAANDSIVLDIVFSARTIAPVEPAWVVAAEQAQKLRPAFIAAAIALLVIGAGTVVMVMVRMSSMRPDVGPMRLDAERLSTSRGLITAGVVLILVAVASAAVLSVFLERLGSALLALPAAAFVDAIAFLVAGGVMSRRRA